jgi:hypothetical protein
MSGFKYAKGLEDNPITLMDRVRSIADVNITQASVTAITYRVFEYATQAEAEQDIGSSEVGTTGTLTVNSVVYDTLQTAAPWDSTIDATGYNFRFTLPGSRRPTGGKWYRVQVTFDMASGSDDDFDTVWLIEALPKAGG